MASVERMQPLLGTFVTIRAQGQEGVPESEVTGAVSAAFSAIARVQRLMSFHSHDSDVGRLNRARPGCHLRVHRWTSAVLSEALQLHMASAGAFDCNVGRVLVRGGLLPRSRPAVVGRSKTSMSRAIRLAEGGRVNVAQRVSLDLGGIAKGFAVDQAVRVLRSRGMQSGLVNAGGDLYAFGSAPQEIWVRCPKSPTDMKLIGRLQNGAVATSASYFASNLGNDGKAASAIVNPRHQRRVGLPGSVSVVAKSCLQADALTKIVALRGSLPASIQRRARATVIRL